MGQVERRTEGSEGTGLRKLSFYSLPVAALLLTLCLIVEKGKETKLGRNGLDMPGWRKLCLFLAHPSYTFSATYHSPKFS